jgi:hypothetical protein
MKPIQTRINHKPFAIYCEDACSDMTSSLKRYLPDYQEGVQIRIYPVDVQTWDIIVSYDELTNEELEAIRAGGPYEQTNRRTGEWETILPEPEEA